MKLPLETANVENLNCDFKVLKTITYDNFRWVLINFPDEEYRWVSENDLTEEQQEYLYSMSPFQIELENSFDNNEELELE